MFKSINGGILIDYFGEVNLDGNIVFYEQPIGRSLFSKTTDFNGKSFWSKVKIEKIEHYKPDW